ncbi:MAG: RNA pyrophosphohydrolase [Hyphomicrobiaceae bacterium]|nr:RNA pyrophosphohydrolase [Hyphomicrobiaceae bacterium]
MALVDPTGLGYRPCVGIMLVNSAGLVWIGRRAGARTANDPEGAGSWWQMPQGGIDEGEDPRKAALRELAEETGIGKRHVTIIGESADWHTYDLPPELIGKVWKGRYRGQKQKWFVMRFTGPDSAVDITPPNPDHVEFDAWRWAHVDELIGLIVPFKRDVYRAVVGELGGLARAG